MEPVFLFLFYFFRCINTTLPTLLSHYRHAETMDAFLVYFYVKCGLFQPILLVSVLLGLLG